MSKLIVILTLFWTSHLSYTNDVIILILDDCDKWTKMTAGLKGDGDFILSTNLPDNHTLLLGHVEYSNIEKLSIWKAPLSKILYSEPIYSSTLNYDDWYGLMYGKDRKKIYVLRPQDFCSENRFLMGYQFTLFEMTLYLSAHE